MLDNLLSNIRVMRMRAVFRALENHVQGRVLDVGGRSFFKHIVADKNISFTSWTCLEQQHSATEHVDTRYTLIVGDGEQMAFADESFDSVLNIQVLEHTVHPEKMVAEISRVLKTGGKAVFVIPQTSAMHEIPTHYFNFTKYWVEAVFPVHNLKILELQPLGGRWGTHASHMVYFFLEAFRYKSFSSKEYKRPLLFYPLFPFMAVYAALGIVFGLIFSFGDLTEDPNNLLVVAEKL